jgi:hypothetical protein
MNIDIEVFDATTQRPTSNVVEIAGPTVVLESTGIPFDGPVAPTAYTAEGNVAESEAMGLFSDKPLRRNPPRRLSKD